MFYPPLCDCYSNHQFCSLSSDWGYRPDDFDGGTCVVDVSFGAAAEDRGDEQCSTG